MEQSPIAIIEWDVNLQVIEWNAAAVRIFGYSREEALGMHIGRLVPPESRQSVLNLLKNLDSGHHNDQNTSQNLCRDGSIIKP